jgi:preprotein translocase SecE subunit
VSKVQSAVQGIKTFWSEVVAEGKKCEWPARQALVESTVVVVVSVLLLSLFVAVSDKLLVTLLKLLIGLR